MTAKCSDCKFWDAGQCRRYPPQLVPWPQDNQHPIAYVPSESWPTVRDTDWCGEFKTKRNDDLPY